jgi:hypothetical protein
MWLGWVKPCENHKPFILNAEFNDELAYRTKDLVVPHPSKPNLWKMCAYISLNHSFHQN